MSEGDPGGMAKRGGIERERESRRLEVWPKQGAERESKGAGARTYGRKTWADTTSERERDQELGGMMEKEGRQREREHEP